MTFISQNIVSRSELNGCFARISGPFDPESCRWPVRIFLKEGACPRLRLQSLKNHYLCVAG